MSDRIETTHEADDGFDNYAIAFNHEENPHGNWIRGVTQTMDKIGTLMSKDAVHRTILTIRS